MKSLIRKIIQINSISGDETKLGEFMVRFLHKLGVKSQMIGEGNMVVRFSGEDATKLMIFNAHLDTVTAGNLADWKYPPLGQKSGVIKSGKIYGLGASDEKASIATLLLLAERLKVRKPPIDVFLTFVVGEEIDGRGTKNVLKHFGNEGILNQYRHISGVICEPTGLKEIQIAHKGNVFLKLTVRGDAGHGSEPEKIKSQAIKSLMKAIGKIEKLDNKWIGKFQDKLLGKPTISLTSFQAGDVNCPNSFPSLAEATFDIRTVPRMHQLVVKSIKKILEKTRVGVSTVGELAPAGYTDKNDPLVKAAKLICPRAKVTTIAGSTDQCFFSERNIPAIIFGPGEDEVVHKSNEYCYLTKIEKCVQLYEKLIFTWGSIVGKMKDDGSPVRAAAII